MVPVAAPEPLGAGREAGRAGPQGQTGLPHTPPAGETPWSLIWRQKTGLLQRGIASAAWWWFPGLRGGVCPPPMQQLWSWAVGSHRGISPEAGGGHLAPLSCPSGSLHRFKRLPGARDLIALTTLLAPAPAPPRRQPFRPGPRGAWPPPGPGARSRVGPKPRQGLRRVGSAPCPFAAPQPPACHPALLREDSGCPLPRCPLPSCLYLAGAGSCPATCPPEGRCCQCL